MGVRLVVDQAKTLLMRHARTLRRNSRLGWVRAPNLPAPQMHCTTSGAGRSTRRVSIAVLERAFRRFRGLAGCLGPVRHRHALGPLSRSSHDLDQALAHPHGIILTHLQCLTLRHEDEQQPCPTCACRQAHAPGRPESPSEITCRLTPNARRAKASSPACVPGGFGSRIVFSVRPSAPRVPS